MDLSLLPVLAIPLGFLAALLTGKALAASGILPIPDESRRMGCLDGLRGYLALMVCVHHFVLWRNMMDGQPWGHSGLPFYENLGQTGVGLFFMASGALFYRKVAAGIRENGIRGIDWRALYLSRLFRIVPLMWLVTALVLAVVWMRGGRPQPGDGLALLQWLTFVANPDLLGHPKTSRLVAHVVWSLRYEWAFYLALPALAAALAATRALRLPNLVPLVLGTGLLLALPGLRIGLFHGILIAFFGLGMIAVEISERTALRPWLRGPAAAALGLAALAVQMNAFPQGFGAAQGLLMTAFFVPVLAGNSYFRLLDRQGSVALGELSYGIYLLHGLALSLLMLDLGPRLGPGVARSWAMVPAVLVLVTLVSAATFLWLEKPMIRIGRDIARRRRTRPLPSV